MSFQMFSLCLGDLVVKAAAWFTNSVRRCVPAEAETGHQKSAEKKECLFLTNKAIMLLKTKGRENEQSRTKPIQVALLSFQGSGIQVALGYSSARAGAARQRCAPPGARAEPQTQGSSRQGGGRPPSGEVTQACSASDLFLKVCGLSVRASKKPRTYKTGPRYSLSQRTLKSRNYGERKLRYPLLLGFRSVRG